MKASIRPPLNLATPPHSGLRLRPPARPTVRAFLIVTLCAILAPVVVGAESLSYTFSHQVLVTEPARDWEHRIDLPEAAAIQGKVFVKRDLNTLMGKLAVVTEEFTPLYYYVKVRLPKLPGQPMAGQIKIDLEVAEQPSIKPPLPAPAKAKIFEHSAARKPVFTWDGKGKYGALTLLDVATGKTIWERISTAGQYFGFDEGFLPLGTYRWAVKQSDASGRWSKETQAVFQIVEKDGIVVIIEN